MQEFIHNFYWLRPLWLLAIPIAIISFYFLYHTNNNKNRWKKLIDPELATFLLENSANRKSALNRILPLIFLALSTITGLIALAGPSWEKLPTPVVQKQDTLVIIADLTLSMHAQDISPSRLIRMRYKLLELLKQRKEGQTALIAYSGDAHIVSPLTEDANTIAAMVPTLSPEIMPSIGSNAAAAFELAGTLLGSENHNNSTIVWLTDQSLPRDLTAIRKTLSTGNRSLLIIGIGTEQGGPIPLPSGKFLKDKNEQQVINAKLNKDALVAAARAVGGFYIDLRNDNSDINFILKQNSLNDRYDEQHQKIENQREQKFDAQLDRGAWLCILLLPASLLAFRRGWILSLFIVALPFSSDLSMAQETEPTQNAASQKANPVNQKFFPFGWDDLWKTKDQQAYSQRQRGNLESATQTFKNPDWKAVSAYENNNFQQASDYFQQSLDAAKNTTNISNQQLAKKHYNHGHALAKQSKLDQALSAYDHALELDPDFEDAKKSKEIVKALLEQQKEQQESSDSQQENTDENTEQSQEDQQQQKNSDQNQKNSQEQSDQQQDQQQNAENQQQADQQTQTESEQQENSAEENKDEESDQQSVEQAKQENKEANEKENMSKADLEADKLSAEKQARLQQWLNKIEDDPSGLLRRKFQYERSLKERQGEVIDKSEDGQLW